VNQLGEWWEGLGGGLQRLTISVGLVLVLSLVRWIVLRTVRLRVSNNETFFRSRKWIAYAVTLVGAFGLAQIWFGGLGGLGTYLGILSAGIAIALADVLENLAAWIYIVGRRPFKIGDRIEVGGRVGDVVDVRAFRFSMLEVGNWVDADQSTGRLIHVPNGKVFTEHLINYTEGFPYIWEELGVLVTFESDWRAAEALVVSVLAEHAPDTSDGAVERAIRDAGNIYLIRYTHITPTTYVKVLDSGVNIIARYLVGVRERRSYQDGIWRAVLDGIAENDRIELAYPTIRAYIPEGTGGR